MTIFSELYSFTALNEDETAVSTSLISKSRSSLKRSAYRSKVMAADEWPSIRCMAFTFAPECTAMDAAVCRRSWARIGGTPDRSNARVYQDAWFLPMLTGWTYPPCSPWNSSSPASRPSQIGRNAEATGPNSGTSLASPLLGVPRTKPPPTLVTLLLTCNRCRRKSTSPTVSAVASPQRSPHRPRTRIRGPYAPEQSARLCNYCAGVR